MEAGPTQKGGTNVSQLSDDPYGKYNGNEIVYLRRALNSGDEDNKRHPWPQRFEEAFSEKLGTRYAIACNSGTSALHAALFAAGVESGHEVISPGLTVVMDAFATIHLGARPVFADVDPVKKWVISIRSEEHTSELQSLQ